MAVLGADNPAILSAPLASLFPAGVIAAELREPADATLLMPEELEHVARSVDKRVRDYAGGRLCARRALGELGIHGFALRSAEDRTAIWPDTVVGSITHTSQYCAAVVAPRNRMLAVGIDAEVIGRVTPPMRSMICTDEECAWIDKLDSAQQSMASALVFSSKEAFYKCQYTLSRQWVDFKEACLVPERCDLANGRYVLRVLKSIDALSGVGSVLEGRFVVDGPRIVTTMAFVASGHGA